MSRGGARPGTNRGMQQATVCKLLTRLQLPVRPIPMSDGTSSFRLPGNALLVPIGRAWWVRGLLPPGVLVATRDVRQLKTALLEHVLAPAPKPAPMPGCTVRAQLCVDGIVRWVQRKQGKGTDE